MLLQTNKNTVIEVNGMSLVLAEKSYNKEKRMLLVVADHPYYPEVYVCKNMEEAETQRKILIEDIASEDGEHDFTVYISEILFQDNADYIIVKCAKMIQEGNLIRFICFDTNNNWIEDIWYPMINIFRIKQY